MQRAVFIDRDGTLVHARHYPTRPDQLELYEGLPLELRRLQQAGFCLVVITNQSGLARGLFGMPELEEMHRHLREQLAGFGVRLDAIYVCPHHPEGSVANWAVDCDCRKPRPGMLLRAAADLRIDLARSWFVGDILDDVEAGNRAGCRTVLIDLGTEGPPDLLVRRPTFVARDAVHAMKKIQAAEGLAVNTVPNYRPPAWAHARWRPADAIPVSAPFGRSFGQPADHRS